MLRIDQRYMRNIWWLIALTSIFVPSCKPASPPALAGPLPEITSVESSAETSVYHLIELNVILKATYDSPYDFRQVDLHATFQQEGGKPWVIPGYWDAKGQWLVRFSPPAPGIWNYAVQVRDHNGPSPEWKGKFTATPSGGHGWLQVGSWVNPAYSPRYLAFQDGTPFYGVGHCDAFSAMSYGYTAAQGYTLFDKMQQAGENMLVYWPIYSNPFFDRRYDQYSASDLRVIDGLVADAEKKGIYLVFTIWDHNEIRDRTHAWGNGEWENNNGFRLLGKVGAFFIDPEMWAWQENLYRYLIARYSYSPAIGLWMTVSEIDGTNAYLQTDAWNRRVYNYFAQDDPYRHPVTASKAGDAWWPGGYPAMDITQMHSYKSQDDPVGTGPLIASWTQKLWANQAKPSFIGEFGSASKGNFPELLHNGLWAALSTGAAATPMLWNDNSAWGWMTDEKFAQMKSLADFVSDLPLVKMDPAPVKVSVSGAGMRVWGMGVPDQVVVWAQDASLSGKPVEEVRQKTTVHTGINLTLYGMDPGKYTIRPYDTWQGKYLTPFDVTLDNEPLVIPLPDFSRDIAVKIEKSQ